MLVVTAGVAVTAAGAATATPGASLLQNAAAAHALVARPDATPVDVVAKLDYVPVASYRGGVPGLAATSPRVTGKKLKESAAAVAAYQRHVAQVEAAIVARIRAAVPGAVIGIPLRVAYGGIALRLSADQIDNLRAVEGVVAVHEDRLEQPLTDASPTFVGAAAVWPSLGGSATAGQGVLVGVIDTGIWPEHASFADPGISHPGGTYGCEFGNGSDPSLGAPFTCNDKLIGAYAKTATYLSGGRRALPGEFCNNSTKVCSPRDPDGHGTHVAGTAAGSPVASAMLLGVDRGPISGIAPGAHVIAYRVCLEEGCFNSDSVAAVSQAILDGVDVINFSISGGSNAYGDVVELAFLDAYGAGILVNASAGNDGPGAATANHAGPWTNTVGASTSNRHFRSTLNLAATGGATFSMPGVTVTAGISTPADVVKAESINGDSLCQNPLPAGSAAGRIVMCRRGTNARVDKGFNVLQGGAAGMILYNPTLQGLNSDNHWLPAIHTEGPPTALLDFVDSNTGVQATWVSGTASPVPGDLMASFSSRGPLGDFVKPDVTTVGVQVLAGHTPAPIGSSSGPPNQLYQAIAGTSMSSPHSAGVSALVKAAHPDWTPGQIKSALMTSSVQSVLKEDGATPATPFDRGAGSVRATRAVDPGVTFDVTHTQYQQSASDPASRIHLNLPSVNAPNLTSTVTTQRTLKNVSGSSITLSASTTAPPGATIAVSPQSQVVAAGATATIEIAVNGVGMANGQYFGQLTLQRGGGGPSVVLPVAFRKVTAPAYTLAVTKGGTGSGTVTSSPAGIDCGSICDASYPEGASVTLTATAASGSAFAGWSGACTGTGVCTVSMTLARSVNATFNTSSAPTFSDVPSSHPFFAYIEEMFERGITTGCFFDPGTGERRYCPLNQVTRQEMAVFLIRALGEPLLTPTTPTFSDVPASHPFYGHIERFHQLGITTGCFFNPTTGERRYCPLDNVTREAMAAFIVRAKGLSLLTPATPTFSDVPTSHQFYGHIERFFEQGITTGCAPPPNRRFCPLDNVTREAMAAFVIRAFPAP